MAKPFDSKEKLEITNVLIDVGLKRFTRFGVRAVRIDDLCRDVGISKGSFYAFFPSKEALFMEIAQRRDNKHKQEMRRYLQEFSGQADQLASGFFDLIIDKINTDPMMQLMIEHGEVEYLVRKIPSEMLNKNAEADREFVKEVARILNQRTPNLDIHPDTIEGLMTLSVALIMQRIMPQPQFNAAKKLLHQVFIDKLSIQHKAAQ